MELVDLDERKIGGLVCKLQDQMTIIMQHPRESYPVEVIIFTQIAMSLAQYLVEGKVDPGMGVTFIEGA